MGRRRRLPGAEGGIQRWLRVSLIVLMAGLAGAAGFVILALALVAMLRRQAPALQVKRISE